MGWDGMGRDGKVELIPAGISQLDVVEMLSTLPAYQR